MLSRFVSGVSEAQKLAALEDNSPLCAYLIRQEIVALARLCTSHKFKAGKQLPESPFYVVITGQVEAVSYTHLTLPTILLV